MKDNPFPYIKDAQIYVQPSRNEGYGLSIEEAKIVGTPVIASNLPCIKEHFEENIEGVLTEINPHAFASAICHAIQSMEYLKWRDNLTEYHLSHNKNNSIKVKNILSSLVD